MVCVKDVRLERMPRDLSLEVTLDLKEHWISFIQMFVYVCEFPP